jgi:hypothetical protein
VEIVDTQWSSNQVDGTVLSEEANKALDGAEATDCDWGFYIQADEVVHEADLPKVQAACEQWQNDREVKALLFKYLHFVLDYQTTDPWMYHKASRIVRLDRSCRIVGDACGPAMTGYTGNKGNRDGYLDKNFLGTNVRWARDTAGGKPARIFHYGWVKTREQLETKFDMVRQLWWGTLDAEERKRREANKFGKFLDRLPAAEELHRPAPRRHGRPDRQPPEVPTQAKPLAMSAVLRRSVAPRVPWLTLTKNRKPGLQAVSETQPPPARRCR